MKIVNWNTEWANAGPPRGRAISGILDKQDPDVLCLTEAQLALVPGDGHAIESDPDYGHSQPGNRRKVILWNKTPWESVDDGGDVRLPGGRFVMGITQGVRFMGLCIPWRDAHVRTGRRDRKPWEDHLAYLDGLKAIIASVVTDSTPLCALGDFNQRIPRKRVPRNVAERLIDSLGHELSVVTASVRDEAGGLLIDHVAVSMGLGAGDIGIIPKVTEDGRRLSDHSGVIVEVEPQLRDL